MTRILQTFEKILENENMKPFMKDATFEISTFL